MEPDRASPSAASQEELQEQLGGVILSATEQRCKALLNRKQRKAYGKLAQTDPDRALELLEQYVPDFESILADETVRINREMADTQAAVMRKRG